MPDLAKTIPKDRPCVWNTPSLIYPSGFNLEKKTIQNSYLNITHLVFQMVWKHGRAIPPLQRKWKQFQLIIYSHVSSKDPSHFRVLISWDGKCDFLNTKVCRMELYKVLLPEQFVRGVFVFPFFQDKRNWVLKQILWNWTNAAIAHQAERGLFNISVVGAAFLARAYLTNYACENFSWQM